MERFLQEHQGKIVLIGVIYLFVLLTNMAIEGKGIVWRLNEVERNVNQVAFPQHWHEANTQKVRMGFYESSQR